MEYYKKIWVLMSISLIILIVSSLTLIFSHNITKIGLGVSGVCIGFDGLIGSNLALFHSGEVVV